MENKYKFVIYLDLDGVLTSSDYIEYIHRVFTNDNKIKYYGDFEKKSFHYRNFMHQCCFQHEGVECLNKVFNIVPYCIVLTSTRRFEYTPDEWNFIFKLNGIKADIIGRTDSFSFKENKFTWREDEIYKYHNHDNPKLKELPFIVIDDDKFDLMKYEDKLINVKTETGLTMKYFNEMIEKLKAQDVKINNIEGETK